MLLLPKIYHRWRPDMVALRCTCEQGTNLWGEFWWIEGEHRWVFFDDEKTSETYAEQLTHCRGCGRSLERKALRACYELGRKSHRNADFTVRLVPSRSLFPAFLSRF